MRRRGKIALKGGKDLTNARIKNGHGYLLGGGVKKERDTPT